MDTPWNILIFMDVSMNMEIFHGVFFLLFTTDLDLLKNISRWVPIEHEVLKLKKSTVKPWKYSFLQWLEFCFTYTVSNCTKIFEILLSTYYKYIMYWSTQYWYVCTYLPIPTEFTPKKQAISPLLTTAQPTQYLNRLLVLTTNSPTHPIFELIARINNKHHHPPNIRINCRY